MAKQKTATKNREYGNGTIYFRESDKRWVGKWKRGIKPDGKPDMLVVYGKTEAEARKKLNAGIEAARKSNLVYVEKETVSTYMLRWLTTVKVNDLKDKSYDRLEQTINTDVIPRIGHIQLGALTTLDVQQMITDMKNEGKSYSTIKKAYDAVNAAFKYGLSVNPPLVNYNPCSAVKLPNKKLFPASTIKFYTEEEAKILCETAIKKYGNGTPWYRLGAAIILAINTGLREAELAGLEWDRDIDFDDRLLHVNKTVVVVKNRDENSDKKYIHKVQDSAKTDSGDSRPVPLNDDALKALQMLHEVTGQYKYVLATKEGNRVSNRDIDKLLRNVARRAKFPEEKVYGIHALRHTFATLMLKNGVEIKTLSEILGHSDTSVTYNTYIHIIKEQKAKAVQSLPSILSE